MARLSRRSRSGRDDAYGNLERARLAKYQHQLAKIGKPVDKRRMVARTPQTVNAVNLPLQNALNFPAAILDKGFYDPAADAPRNMARSDRSSATKSATASTISARRSTATGKLRNWWTRPTSPGSGRQATALAGAI